MTASISAGPTRNRVPRFRGGLVGAGAAAALTLAFTSVVFGVVAAVATVAAIVLRRRQTRSS